MSTECATRCSVAAERMTKRGVPLAELTLRVPGYSWYPWDLLELAPSDNISPDSNELKKKIPPKYQFKLLFVSIYIIHVSSTFKTYFFFFFSNNNEKNSKGI